jgi:hypothetical protein
MDLRPYIKTPQQVARGIDLIRSNLLFYQPFIIADDLEVGEGQNFSDNYKDVKSVFDMNVYAPSANVGKRRQPQDLAYFRRCNAQYRALYDHVRDQIIAQLGNDISDTSFTEIGCNTGLNLFNLAVAGAKSCHGYDWSDMSPVFSWLNDVLGTDVRFTQGIYDNLRHRMRDMDIPETDVMINTIYLNHQCDPLQFLCYMCDRARKGVFLWTLINSDKEGCSIQYPPAPPHEILNDGKSFPLYFYNGVALSRPLLELSLKRLGFEDITALPPFIAGRDWKNGFQQGFQMFYAKRTKDIRSAFWDMSVDPLLPTQAPPAAKTFLKRLIAPLWERDAA